MRTGAATYAISVDGHLDDHWSAWLGDAEVARHGDATSTITGPFTDQAHLHGVLAGLRDIGAPLLSLRVGDAQDGGLAGDPAPEPALRAPVQSKRLTLRPGTPEDAHATWLYRRLEAVNTWLTDAAGDAAAYATTFTDPSRLAATVVVEREGRIIGDLMLRVRDAWSQTEVAEGARRTEAELGWVLDPRFTGRGYGTEAGGELLRVCFEDLGLRRVVADCFLGNEASWRLMERLGMRRETHRVAESLHRSGRWLDTLGYALLVEEWPLRHPALDLSSASAAHRASDAASPR